MDDGRLLQTLVQHKDLVTCIDASSDGRTVVSGAHATYPHSCCLLVRHSCGPGHGTPWTVGEFQ